MPKTSLQSYHKCITRPRQFFFSLSFLLLLCGLALSFSSCRSQKSNSGPAWTSTAPWGTEPPEFREYLPNWNKQHKEWLLNKKEDIKLEIKEATAKAEQSDTLATRRLFAQKVTNFKEELAVIETRLKDGDYFQFKPITEVPTDLVWENGLDNPDIGDPKAKKGGTMRLIEPSSYPGTFRHFGPNSNNLFRGKLYDEIGMSSVNIHPVTNKIIPAICNAWAISKDGRTVFFKIDPDARYSDGARIRSIDFFVTVYVRTSDYANSPFDKDYFRETFSNFTLYDDRTFSVTLPTIKPLPAYYATSYPSPPHFYSEYGPDFVERYQWRIEPSAGGYTVKPDGVIRGQQVTLSRVQNWWCKDKKFYNNMCNVNHIIYRFMSEESKALELFRVGEIDMMLLNRPDIWHEKMEIPEVHNGFIERYTFYNIYPRYPIGLFLNIARPPMDNLDFRLGIQHSINMDRVSDIIYRGDYQKLNSYCSGYGKYTNPNIKAREYSPEKARQYFAKAGYTKQGSDGILRKPNGTKLSFEVTYSNTSSSLQAMMNMLKEGAKKAGLELALDDLDGNVSYRKVMEKRHQATSWAWGLLPPHPRIHQLFHSSFAFDEKGTPLPNTNNINCIADDELDLAVEGERKAKTEEELQAASWKAQQIIHDRAIWVPGINAAFARIGCWRWVKWPNSDTTQFCHPLVFEPSESHLFWIDEEEKERTLEAKKQGEVFTEKDLIYDQYRFVDQAINANLSPSKQ